MVGLKHRGLSLVLAVLGGCLFLHDESSHVVSNLLHQLVKLFDLIYLGLVEETDVHIE